MNRNDFNMNNSSQNQSFGKKIKKLFNNFTFVFGFFTFLNIFLYLLSFLKNFEMNNYSICLWQIIYKHQYYRMITHNFFHANFVHILFNLIFFYFVGRSLEKKIGSFLTFFYICESVVLIWFYYIGILKMLKYVVIESLKMTEYNYDFYCSIGFSGILFSLYYLFCSFKNVKESVMLLFNFIPIKAKYTPYCYLILMQMMNPKSSFLGHLCGILTGNAIKNFLIFFTFPKRIWIKNFEKKFSNVFDFLKTKFNYHDIETVEMNDEVQELDVKCSDYINFIFRR